MMLSKLPILLIVIILLLSGCGGKSATQQETPNPPKGDNYEYTPSYVPKNNVDVNLQLGIEYMRMGRNEEAMNRLQKALALDPNYAETYGALAVLYERLKQDQQSRQYYERAISLKPNDSDILNNYGQFLCRQNQWVEAEQLFLKAIENPLYKTPEITYRNAAICVAKNRDFTKAEAYLQKALQINSNFAPAFLEMADICYETRRYTQAREHLQKYLTFTRHTAQTLWIGIRIERALGNKNAEASYAMLLRSQFPNSEQARLLSQTERP